ncbi:MAG: phosphatidate cytidylyltransferase [Candidatus Improbicoccus devescovinae]|nr:MAG: phosphatidate cytidylyltransferase [Candidatus Improbicoccus devescovinae]
MLYQRFISGFTGFVFMLLVLFASNYYNFLINLVMSVITVVAVKEILDIRNMKSYKVIFFASMGFSMCRCLLGPGVWWRTCFYCYTLIVFIIFIKEFKKPSFNKKNKQKYLKFNIIFVYILTLFISVALGEIVAINNLGAKNSKIIGIFYTYITLGLAFSCDIGAYLMGKYFGKNKLCPSVSPAKTVEGAVGGALMSLGFIVCSGFMFNFLFKIPVNILNLAFLSLLGAPIAILGDLCFSIIKRTSSIKDFSDLIPGHGGILDRFDSVIFTAPYVYIFINFINIIN